MSSDAEARLLSLLVLFRLPAPWADLQVAAEEYNRACIERNQLREMGKFKPDLCFRATFSDDGRCADPARLAHARRRGQTPSP